MEVTEIRIHLRNEEKLKAFVTITFDSCFVVRNMKVVQGAKGLILCMPSRKLSDGSFKDVAHPITAEFRKVLEDKVMAAFQEEVKKSGGNLPPSKTTDSGVV
ncbi:MAG: septation protein SpoVG family protein [Elusimicrobia bacterium]|nr:septation protein SpoVG family protein [Elusimicrobiota bacterium]